MTKTPEWLQFLHKQEEACFVVQDNTAQIIDALQCLLLTIHEVELDVEEFKGMTKKQMQDYACDDTPDIVARDRAWLRTAKKHFGAGIRELRKRYKDRWRFNMEDADYKPIYGAILKAPDHVFLNVISDGL